MRILITGSCGFIGGSVGRFATAGGHLVLGMDRPPQRPHDWPARYIQADVASADLSEIMTAFKPDVIVHAAGTASVGASFDAPLEDLRASVLTWASVLDSARRSGIEATIVFLSSAAVYGNPPALPVHEEMPIRPISPYGFHKAACELLAREYVECHGLDILVLRLFSVFGERQRRLLVWELYQQFTNSAPDVWLEGTGTESRDFLHIDDFSAILLELLAQRPGTSQLATVNLASGIETTTLDLAIHVGAALGIEKPVRCRGINRPGDPTNWVADVSRLRTLAPAWRPPELSTAVLRVVSNWQRDKNPLRDV